MQKSTSSHRAAGLCPAVKSPLAGVTPTRRRLRVFLAHTQADVEDAQRLRYAVFAGEMGANLDASTPGLDLDEFDRHCEHLLVRDEDSRSVVGTYRILAPHRQAQIGRLYADSEFDLSPLNHLRPSLVEVGRSCVHPEYRTGPTILLLWAGLAKFMRNSGYGHLIGCASVSLADGGKQAAALRDQLLPHLADSKHRVVPRLAFPHERIAHPAAVELPPLIKGYLRLGAKVCGEPAWDPDFNTADFLIWLSLENMRPRYARHFDMLATQAHALPQADLAPAPTVFQRREPCHQTGSSAG